MITRLIAATLLGALLIGGIIAAFYIHAIESVLTPQQMAMTMQSMSAHSATGQGHNKSVSTRGFATPTPTAAPTATATPVVMSASVLAQDTFQRSSQALWGNATNGQNWQGDANVAPAFSITGSSGQIAGNHIQGVQTYNALLGPTESNVDIIASGHINQFGNGVNFGVVLRWTDTNNWYKALIDGSNLTVLKRVNGVTTQLGTIHFPASGNTRYTLHFRAIGATLYASAWPSDQTAPAEWMLVVSDMSLTHGLGGIRVVEQPDTVIQVVSFLETTAYSGI